MSVDEGATHVTADDEPIRELVKSTRGRRITVRYVNHRGEEAERDITPLAIVFGWSEWHGSAEEPVWLMQVWDHDKDGQRTFALADCNFRWEDL